jgi:hypothetical protein
MKVAGDGCRGWLQDKGSKSESCRIKVEGVMVAAVKVRAVVVAGAAMVAGVVVGAWWRCWVIDGIRVGAGEPQVSYGLGEGCVDEPGPETSGAHHGQRIVDGGHGLTEPEPEPKRAMAQWQRWLCPLSSPERWGSVDCGCRAVAVAGWWRMQVGDGCRAVAVAGAVAIAGRWRLQGRWQLQGGDCCRME